MIVLNSVWKLVNFRSGLIKAMVSKGYEGVTVAPKDKLAPKLSSLGCRFVSYIPFKLVVINILYTI